MRDSGCGGEVLSGLGELERKFRRQTPEGPGDVAFAGELSFDVCDLGCQLIALIDDGLHGAGNGVLCLDLCLEDVDKVAVLVDDIASEL